MDILESIKNNLNNLYPQYHIEYDMNDRKIVTIKGECDNWQDVVDIGHIVAKEKEVRNVVNELTVKGLEIPKIDYETPRKKGEEFGEIDSADIVIIGAGVSGCGIARTLSKYNKKIIVVDACDDVACGASKANNGNIHAGNAVTPGTLKAKLNVKGNAMYTKWAEELGFELQRIGDVFATTREEFIPKMDGLMEICKINGVPAERISPERAYELEPSMALDDEKIVDAVHIPSMGEVDPYEVCVALAENAAANGVIFKFETMVCGFEINNNQIEGVITNRGIIKAKTVINAAGVYADEMSELANDKCYTIHPRKGTILILDKNKKPLYNGVSGLIKDEGNSNTKNKNSKGGGMCRTAEGNILLGPSATEVYDKEDNSTDTFGFEYDFSLNKNENVTPADVIRIFAGVRPSDYKEDFWIEMSPVTHGFINCGAIQSPGLASAPAIAEMVENIVLEDAKANNIEMTVKTDYNPIRERKIPFRKLTREQQADIIAQDPRYGKVICRCETITEGEIVDVIHSLVVPTSIDAIKRRTRAGMGRCQGGFCQPRVLEIIARELGIDRTKVTLKGGNTNILLSDSRKNEEGK